MDIRDRTLSALEEYITKQRSLLETTQRDIQELQRLRDDALYHPDSLIDNLPERLGQPSFSLSQQSCQLLEARQPPVIDWEVLQSKDPALFTNPDVIDTLKLPDFASIANSLDPANHPLRAYVHESAMNLLSLLPPLSPSPPPERELSAPTSSTPRLRKSQESSLCGPRRTTRKHKPKFLRDGAAVVTSRSLPRPRAATNGHTHTRAASTSSSESSLTPHSFESEEDEEEEPSVNGNGTNEWKRLTIVIPPLKVKRRTQPTETFNQSWSLEEQHLLEQLLIEIPKGVKQRWARISLRMGGRRSARQVASRVQKYFEKLSKAGIDHPG